jgi:hypothetical protein
MDVEFKISDKLSIKLGDRVTGKRTGQLVPSTIVGCIPASIYVAINGDNASYLKRNKLYPNWMEDVVVYCRFDEPTKNITYEEFSWQFDIEWENMCASNNWLIKAYEENNNIKNIIKQDKWESIVEVLMVAYPIEDIEVI